MHSSRTVPLLLLALGSGRAAAAEYAPSGIILDGDTAKPMPALGYGTCCRASAKGPPLVASTKEYLAQGGRLIDTAQMYGNHRDIATAIRESGVPREQIWLTSKLNTAQRAMSTRTAADLAVRQTAEELGTKYVDLMLIHGLWAISEAQAVEVWRGLIDAKAAGIVRHIGVSNFERPQLERLIAATGVKPSVLQLEYHPYVATAVHELVGWARQQGIAIVAYGSLGGAGNKGKAGGELAKLAATHGVSTASLLLRWALEQGHAVIPGATSAEHIRQNLHPPALKLSGDDLAKLSSNAAGRPGSFKSWTNLPTEIAKKRRSRKTKKTRKKSR